MWPSRTHPSRNHRLERWEITASPPFQAGKGPKPSCTRTRAPLLLLGFGFLSPQTPSYCLLDRAKRYPKYSTRYSRSDARLTRKTPPSVAPTCFRNAAKELRGLRRCPLLFRMSVSISRPAPRNTTGTPLCPVPVQSPKESAGKNLTSVEGTSWTIDGFKWRRVSQVLSLNLAPVDASTTLSPAPVDNPYSRRR